MRRRRSSLGEVSGTWRIAHLAAVFPPYFGGAGTTCFYQACELAERGHHVEVLTAAAAGSSPQCAALVHRIRPALSIGNAPLIPRIARLRGFDIVHLHYPFIFGTELVLIGRLRQRGAALVVTYHNRLIGDGMRRPLFWGYEEFWGRLLVGQADRVCPLSDAHGETVSYLQSTREREPEKLVALPNGVALDVFKPGPDAARVRDRLRLPPEAVLMAFVATLDRAHFSKRLDLAIEALARTRDDDLHLLVVGGGDRLEHYRAQSARAGLSGRVHFVGAAGHDVLPDLLRAADFFLLTSDLESFGIVVLEAMASGLPVVSTDAVGVRELVRPGYTGLLASRGDEFAIAERMSQMVELGSDRRRELGAAGRAECERLYAWPRIVDRLEGIYEAALAHRRAG